MQGYYPLPRSDGKPDKKPVKLPVVCDKQLELPGLKNSAVKPRTPVQKCFDLIEQVFRRSSARVQSRISEIELHTHGYAEPGYKNPESNIIATGNWNSVHDWDKQSQKSINEDKTVCELGGMLEELGAELEWGDEWRECDVCNGLLRTTQDSYGWKHYYWDEFGDGNMICAGCIKKDRKLLRKYLAELEGQSNKADVLDLDLAKLGYTKVNGDFENGWYDGQNDDPKAIAAALRKLGITRFIFSVDSVGQFDVHFTVHVHRSQIKKYNDAKFHEQPLKQVPSPAERMMQALQSVPIATGPGITVTKCQGNGTATSRQLSPQEFVEKGIGA
jgi:hypothetical protein